MKHGSVGWSVTRWFTRSIVLTDVRHARYVAYMYKYPLGPHHGLQSVVVIRTPSDKALRFTVVLFNLLDSGAAAS